MTIVLVIASIALVIVITLAFAIAHIKQGFNMGIRVNPGQIINASHYQTLKNDANNWYNRISSAPYRGTKPTNSAYRPHYNYNFSRLRVQSREVIYAWKYNDLSSTLDDMIRRDCVCDCNYCTCNCNYCRCNCDYCTCNCNYCTCNCHHQCTCNCAY